MVDRQKCVDPTPGQSVGSEDDDGAKCVDVSLSHPEADSNPFITAALAYAARGWRVHPLRPRDKLPTLQRWPERASTDPDTIRRWWAKEPTANIGIATGSGLLVLDVDGDEGRESLNGHHLPPTVCALTGGGGIHYLFEVDGETRNTTNLLPHVDTRGDGGYIVAAPSIHPDTGAAYTWADGLSPDDLPLAPAPQWLVDALRPKAAPAPTTPPTTPTPAREASRTSAYGQAALDREAVAVAETAPGGRNARLNQAAFSIGSLVGGGEVLRADAERTLTAAGREAGLEDREVAATVASGLNSGALSPRSAPGAGPDDPDQGTEPKAKAKVHTHELAQALLAAGKHFARDAGGKLYAFEGGRYTSDGRRIVESGCKAILEEWGRPDSWSSYRASEVEKYILADAPDLWDRPPVDTLNLANGLLDVETATLRPHDPAFLSPVQIPVAFDPEATCPNWDRFVSEVFPQDAQALAFEIVAWLMLPDTGIQKAVLLLGAGANGKSTYLRAVTSFLGGRQNVVAQSLHRLEQNRFATARLIGKLANICPDLPSAHLEETTIFKALTGGDGELDVERKGIDPFAAPIYARLVFSANHPPQSRDTSKAFFRRWLVVPFEASFDPDGDRPVKTEMQMDAELCCPAEQSGLLNRALQALAQVRTGTLSEPESCRVAHAEFEAETDPLRVWLDAHIVAGPGMLVRKDELRRRYNQDAQREGRPLLTHHAFTPALRRAYPGITEGKRTIGGTRVKCWLGIGLVDAPVYDVENDESGVGL